ncbi:RNA polymerase sigma factor SigV [bioreactor metagenome]|uniref:RNA polymerase sigma factor SigV n=1 Tax=bioreactor metagenome TaxID=1076179 RepID=A0A645BVF9_9ZZZZ
MTEQEYVAGAEAVKERLYRTALLYLSSESMAVDAVDEAVYKGFLAYRRLRQPQFFTTWMTRILINVCHGILRRRRREVAAAELPETAGPEAYDALPLRETVAQLPEQLRQIIILRFFTGLTLEETAESLGIPRGTASTRQRRALALLRLELTEGEDAV